jgi:hypothetical protein
LPCAILDTDMASTSPQLIQFWRRRNVALGFGLAAFAGLIFWILAQRPSSQLLNYTFTIGAALLHGQLGITNPPAWLNELVPAAGGRYYSVFPLGAVLSVLPFSALVVWRILPTYPVNLVVGLLAAGCVALGFGYTFVRAKFTPAKRAMLALWLVAGTWFMANMLFAGAWQLALGFAVLGELAALYWSAVKPRPVLAGLGLAIAFGNRTEVLLVAPIILAFLLRPHWHGLRHWKQQLRDTWPIILKFAIFPVLIGIFTLLYNHARFGSPADFGYARLPGILDEPWYRQGIFSLSAIGENAHQMLWQGWRQLTQAPYVVPTGWGGSIVLASPFLLLLIRKPKGDRFRVITGWAALVVLTIALWLHGNTGGWQYSYRYALILLPWFLVLLVEYLPDRITRAEAILWTVSVAISSYATYLFLWTNYLR